MLKLFANRGVERNKKHLRNIVYKVEISDLKPDVDKSKYEQYKFKDLGYMTLLWGFEGLQLDWHGFITVNDLKSRIGDAQYSKFCQGKRVFIIQRRVDNKNVKKK